MLRHHRIEAARARDRLARLQCAFGDGVIARGIKRNHLIQHQRLALLDLDFEFLPDVTRLLDHPAPDFEQLPVEERPRTRRLRDMNIRLACAHQQAHAILAGGLA